MKRVGTQGLLWLHRPQCCSPLPSQVLGLQELGLHPGHLTELLGVCPWALHLAPADGHHLHPWGHNMSGLLLPKLALHVEREAAASAARKAGMRQHCFSPSLSLCCPYLPHCVPPPRPARSLLCSAGSWTVRPPGRSGWTEVKGKTSTREPEPPHCP